jgi:HEAT repeat protein
VADTLARRLSDPSAQAQNAAWQALFLLGLHSSISPPPALVAALGSDGPADVRAAAAGAVAGFGDRAQMAVIPLAWALSDSDPRVRYLAARALAGLGPGAREAVPALIAAVKEPAAPEPGYPSPYLGQVRGEQWDPVCQAARALGVVAPWAPEKGQAVAALAEVVRSGHPSRRVAAATGLSDMGPLPSAAVPDLITLLRESLAPQYGTEMSWSAMNALVRTAAGSASAAEAVAALTDALSAESYNARMEAASALGRFGPAAASAVPRLRALKNDPYPWMASRAADTLAKIEAGVEATDPPNPEGRQ